MESNIKAAQEALTTLTLTIEGVMAGREKIMKEAGLTP
jgi:hypothetical protein